MPYDVSVVKCAEYDKKVLEDALNEAFLPIDALSFVRPGMKIAIKANLVTFKKPQAAATVHPALLTALCKLLTDRGASVVVGDSPGGLFTPAYLATVYNATGVHAVEQTGAVLNTDCREREVQYPEAKILKRFSYTSYLDQADAVINVCKLKTHAMMGMTCAAKNMFGVVPGTKKPEMHCRFPDQNDFADMIVDLNEYRRPELVVVDAVVGMEGNGPNSGTPRQIGAILAGKNPYLVDLAAAKIIGIPLADVPVSEAAYRRGLAPQSVDEVSVSGDLFALCIPDYQLLHARGTDLSANPFLQSVCALCLSAKPVLTAQKCVGCEVCKKTCPVHAITMAQKKPVIDRSRCIRCFCCQEFCPQGALGQKRPLVARILQK